MNAQTQAPEPEPLWSADDVARFLNMSKSWVYRRTRAGEIPYAPFGHCYRYSPARIRDYAAQLEAQAASPNVVSLAARRKGHR